ncbi:hypothetical protein [Streptomyces sp. S186]|uniref:hypothetical protein n=1 Tax=Streptomyces sp. S186 TaxID=3434395 RepID=UPI003F670253
MDAARTDIDAVHREPQRPATPALEPPFPALPALPALRRAEDVRPDEGDVLAAQRCRGSDGCPEWRDSRWRDGLAKRDGERRGGDPMPPGGWK